MVQALGLQGGGQSRAVGVVQHKLAHPGTVGHQHQLENLVRQGLQIIEGVFERQAQGGGVVGVHMQTEVIVHCGYSLGLGVRNGEQPSRKGVPHPSLSWYQSGAALAKWPGCSRVANVSCLQAKSCV